MEKGAFEIECPTQKNKVPGKEKETKKKTSENSLQGDDLAPSESEGKKRLIGNKREER